MITALWMFPCILYSQTNISGVVNSYHKVLGINYTESGLKLDNVNGLAVNDRVMLIQMKGATVSTTNNSSFGSVSSMNNAGNYELATVCSVRNDSVFLLQQLLRSYTEADKVQLVKIPRYVDATVTAPLEAAIWDSVSGKGGVLAITVTGTLTLNAPISASAKGFKGGLFYKDGGGCATNAFQNYYHNPTPSSYLIYTNVQRGAYKGESITDLPLIMTGGKGACANGGGGGNNHNNGGGGGSNLTTAGKGGDNLSTTGCAGPQAAIGGYALSSNSGEKFFLGGGGGAGHANNTITSSGGGNGGGIIFIQAQTLVSNGFSISANGANGGNVYGDGASGGGGGGTIILAVTNYSDAVSIKAMGGNGGDVDDENIAGRCYGEGGGGSGGVVYFSGTQPAGSVDISGGDKGAKLNSTCTSATGMNGTPGLQVINYNYMESGTLSGCGSQILNADWLYFKINSSSNNVVLQWALTSTSNSYFLVERKKEGSWLQLVKISTNPSQVDYSFRDANLTAGNYQYRLKRISNQKISYSPMLQTTIRDRQQTISYDRLTQQIFVRGVLEKNDILQIFDLSGKCIYQRRYTATTEGWKVNASFLRTGVYIAKTTKAAIKLIVARQ